MAWRGNAREEKENSRCVEDEECGGGVEESHCFRGRGRCYGGFGGKESVWEQRATKDLVTTYDRLTAVHNSVGTAEYEYYDEATTTHASLE